MLQYNHMGRAYLTFINVWQMISMIDSWAFFSTFIFVANIILGVCCIISFSAYKLGFQTKIDFYDTIVEMLAPIVIAEALILVIAIV